MNVEIIEQNGHKFLWIDGVLWMWDVPAEQRIQKELADQAYGEVLVVGYGLGIVQRFLRDNSNVFCFSTIEKCCEVMQENFAISGPPIGDVVIQDFYEFPVTNKYDCVIGDIWQEIHPAHLSEYVKFKGHAKTLIKADGAILAWGREYFEWLLTQ